MSNGKKIGVRVDAELWERFKKFVEDNHGTTRGSTKIELEKAIDAHLSGANPAEPIHRIENDLSNLNRLIAEIHDENVEADGSGVAPGPSPSTADTHTHTDSGERAGRDADDDEDDGEDTDDLSKPGAKAPKADKVEFVFESLEFPGDGIVTSPKVFDKKVSSAWGFGDRATDDIRERVFDTYHAEAVSVDGASWQVVVGRDPDAVDDAIADWEERQDADEHHRIREGTFDGFDTNGIPKSVSRR